jgi:ABC transporter substrate binding protein
VRAFAVELAKLSPDAILATGTSAIAALKQTTQSIPLVFVIVNDPVAQGFVASVARPGGNITGFSYMDYSVLEKALQLLKQTSPRLNLVGFMFNPDTYPYYEVYLQKLGGVRQLGFDMKPLRVRSEAEITDAFKDLTAADTGLIVPPEPFTSAHRKQIVELAVQYRLPATYGLRDFRQRRGADALCAGYFRHLWPLRELYRPHSQRGASRRTCGPGADQNDLRYQSQDSEDAGHRHSTDFTWAR